MSSFRFSAISLKIWMGLAALLMAICLILVMTLSNMAPRIVVLPQLFSPDTMRFGQFVEATNMGARLKERELIDEMLIRFYVENRYFYVPDGAELAYRYGGSGPVARLSIPPIYIAFVSSKGDYLDNVQQLTETATVDILSIKRQDNTFTVDFDLYRGGGAKRIFSGTRRATIRVGYSPSYVSFRGDFVNPYGLFVTYYNETGLKKR